MAQIFQIPTAIPATVGVFPNQKFAIFGDNLATVTTAGYLNQADLESNPLSSNDVIQAFYSYNLQTQVGSYGVFTVSISNLGVITLTTWVNPSDVLLPVVSGDFAVFNGTSGQIKDAGYLPSNAAKTTVVMASDATTLNLPAVFADTAGTIKNLTKANGTEAANAVTASGQAGVITTSSLTTAGAGTYVITWTNTFIGAGSTILLSLMGGTNTTNISIQATAGSGTSTITITNNTAATALNGTIIIGYSVI